MKETTITTGTRGLMKVADNTDGTDKTVDLYIASSTAISVPQLPWSYSIDGVVSDTRSFNFIATTAWQFLSKIYVGPDALDFIFHIDDTGHVELGGPTDLTIQLQNTSQHLVNVKVGDTYKKAIPYVNVNGVWVQAVPMVMVNSQWKVVV